MIGMPSPGSYRGRLKKVIYACYEARAFERCLEGANIGTTKTYY